MSMAYMEHLVEFVSVGVGTGKQCLIFGFFKIGLENRVV